MSEIPDFLRIRGDEMFRELVTPVVEFKSPASTPRVIRSQFVAPDSYVVMQAEMFEDAKPRVFVSSHLAPEDSQKITDALEAFEREHDRIEKAFRRDRRALRRGQAARGGDRAAVPIRRWFVLKRCAEMCQTCPNDVLSCACT